MGPLSAQTSLIVTLDACIVRWAALLLTIVAAGAATVVRLLGCGLKLGRLDGSNQHGCKTSA